MDYMPQFGQNTTQDVSGMPQDDTMMQLEMQRRLKFADALRQQEMPQGQMVSGIYVAPSITQGLASLANKYVAGQQERDVMKQYGDYKTAKAKKYGDLMTDLAKGKETVTTDNAPYQIQVPNGQATPTDNLGAMQPYNSGMKSIDVPNTTKTSTFSPYSQQEYMAKILQTMPEFAPKFLEADIARKGQQEQLNAQRQYDMLIHKRDRGEKLSDTENSNLFELQKLGITEEAKARENALSRNITLRGQDLVSSRADQANQIAQGKTVFDRTNTLRNDFAQLPEVKSWNVIQPQLVAARKAATDTSGGSDLNLIYAMGKVMDPNSVVREGELQLAGNTGSLGSKLQGYYKSVASGGNLPPSVKKDLLQQIENRATASEQLYNNTKTKYGEIATQYNLNPKELFVEGITTPSASTKVINGITYVNDGQGWHQK